MIRDDLYDPEYMELTDFVMERVAKHHAVVYTRIVNSDGTIVSSNDLDEFMNSYQIPVGTEKLDAHEIWIVTEGADGDRIRELHFPIYITRDDAENMTSLGRVVVGVSENVIMSGIDDPRPKTALILAGVFIVGLSLIYLLISVLVNTQVAAIMVAMVLTMLPSFLYSGFFTPLSTAEWSTWLIGRFIPATYYLDILRGVFLKGTGWEAHWPSLVGYLRTILH